MNRRDTILLVLLMTLWGFNYSIIKLGVDHIDPFLLTAMRFSLAALPLLFFIPRPDVPWRCLIAYGLSFGVGVWGLSTLSIDVGMSIGLASLLLDMSVISSLLIGRFVLHEQVSRAKFIGSLVALLGLVLIMRHNDGVMTPLGLVLVLSASVFWSVNGLIVKRAGTRSVFAFNIWGMAFAPIPLIVLAVIFHGPEVLLSLPSQLDRWALLSAAFQAYPTTLLGYWFWNKMVVKYGVAHVAPMTLLVPVFGLLGGYLFYGERLDSEQIIAVSLIFIGVALGEIKSLKRRKAVSVASI